jgi:predicted kinase
MQAIIFIGIQATGKSSFYKQRFFNTHVRISLDLLKTRHREKRLLEFCLQTRQRFVVDNTNPTLADRQRYIMPARAANFEVIGYYFESRIQDALRRNRQRPEQYQVPEQGVLRAYHKLQLPSLSEGFNQLYYVRIEADGTFAVARWTDEI